MPRPISVHMLGLRLTIDCAPRSKNGQPAHNTTGSRQRQLDPAFASTISNQPKLMAKHRQHGDDDGERQRPPEAPSEVAQLGIVFVVRAPASAARGPCRTSGSCRVVLPNLRMHRAGVDCAGRRRRAYSGVLQIRPCVRPRMAMMPRCLVVIVLHDRVLIRGIGFCRGAISSASYNPGRAQ